MNARCQEAHHRHMRFISRLFIIIIGATSNDIIAPTALILHDQ